MQLGGIHHLTAISAKPRDNLAFYTGLLGMRLVKKTVNQDDVSAYHLFYADGKANPGTDLTFFDFPAAPERRGTNSISRTGLRVAGEKTLGYWRDRLKKAGAVTGDIVEVDGRLTLPFEDGEGQRLVLVDDGGKGTASPWDRSPGAGRTPDPRARSDRADRARAVAHRLRADRDHEHAPRARLCRPRCADPCLRDGRGKGPEQPRRRTACARRQGNACRAAGRRRRPPRRVPHPRRGAVSRLDAAPERACASPTAARSTASISAASISASPTAFCSRSRRMARALRPMSRWKRWVKGWRCRRSWSREGRRSRRG